MIGPPAGWYEDPEHPGFERYWDGESWSELRREMPQGVLPPPPDAAPPVAPAAAEPTGPRRVAALVAGVVVLVAAVGVGVYFLFLRDDSEATTASSPPPSRARPPSTRAASRGTTTTTRVTSPAGPVPFVASASSVRDPGTDACTIPKPTPYDAQNVSDADATPQTLTAWIPSPSDPSPALTLAFAGPTTLTALRITNGYAKVDPCRPDLDRYYQYARPTLVRVDLHDGSEPRTVSLEDTPSAQTVPVTGSTTRVSLQIVGSAPPDSTRINPSAQIPYPVPAISTVVAIGRTGRS